MDRAGLFASLLLFSLGMGPALAQTSGTLRLLIDPGDSFEFVVDHAYRMQQREVTLSGGHHALSFWAPGRSVIDTGVIIVPGSAVQFVLRLPHDPAFVTYRKAHDKWRSDKHLARYVPALASAGGLTWTVLAYAHMDKAYRTLQDDKEVYRTSSAPRSIRTLKEETIPDHQKDLRRARTGFAIASGLTAITLGATVWLWHRSGNWREPVFEDRQKARFEGLTWLPDDHGGVWCAGMSIPIR